MFDPLAAISLQQDTPGLSSPDEPLRGPQDHAGKFRLEDDERGLAPRAGISRLAGPIVRRLQWAHELSGAFARDPH
ncbi:hypothetical protein ACVIJ6_006839 [Bradyrhizobium sp. USDA 4369]